MAEPKARRSLRERIADLRDRFAENVRLAERRRLAKALDATPAAAAWVLLEIGGNKSMIAKMNDGWEIVSHTPARDDQSLDGYVMRKRRDILARELSEE